MAHTENTPQSTPGIVDYMSKGFSYAAAGVMIPAIAAITLVRYAHYWAHPIRNGEITLPHMKSGSKDGELETGTATR